MRALGAFVMVLGAAICAFAWAKMPTSVNEADYQVLGIATRPTGDTLNIGLLQDQHMVWEAGLAVLIVGALFLAAGIVAATMRERGRDTGD